MISKPTTRRRIVAAILVGIAFLYTVAVKLLREEASQALAPPWLAGVLPNLVCAAVVPLMLFTSPRIVTVRDYVTMTLFIALGLEVYEATQLMMPRRTFDWADVWATAAGVPVALVLGAGFFRPARTDLK